MSIFTMPFSQEQRFRNEVKRIIRDAVSSDAAILEDALSMPLNKIISNSKQQMKAWGPNYNYHERALCVLMNFTFDLLSSGQYHLHRGVLSPVGEKMFSLYEYCIASAASFGYITKGQMNDQLDFLIGNIETVG